MRCQRAARRHGPWLAGTALVLAACAESSGLGGFGLPQQRDGGLYPGVRRDIVGIVQVAPDGCINVKVEERPYLAIWPRGSLLADVVQLPDGDLVAAGDRVVGVGALTPVAPLRRRSHRLLGQLD